MDNSMSSALQNLLKYGTNKIFKRDNMIFFKWSRFLFFGSLN